MKKLSAILIMLILTIATFGLCLQFAQASGSTQNYTFAAKWGGLGQGDGQFWHPYGIAFDQAGNAYVVDQYNCRIEKFDSNGNFLTTWGTSGSGDGQLNDPIGIAIDKSDNVYVTDTYNNRVEVFTSSGNYVTQFGSIGGGDGLHYPIGIALDSLGNIYVVDQDNNRILKFSQNGVFLSKWGFYGMGEGQFNTPSGIAVDNLGYVYVTDTYNHRIEKFTSDGTFVTQWGTYGSGDGQFDAPYLISFFDGGVYVADYSNNCIQKFSTDGTFLAKFGTTGTGDGQLKNPAGVAVNSFGVVYVSDTANNRIQKFEAEWQLDLTATIGTYTDTTQIGVKIPSTTGFDTSYDAVNPPPPPTGVDSYIWCPSNPTSPVDLRKLSTSMVPPQTDISYAYEVTSIGITDTLTIGWSSSSIQAIPQEYAVLLLDSQGNLIANMRNTNTYSLAAQADQTYSFTVRVVLEYTLTLNLNAGWNMVSFPVTPINDTSFAGIFSGSGYYQVITWSETSYVTATSIEAGCGYWVLVLAPTTLTITGIPTRTYSQDLPAGWSMIGSTITASTDANTVFPGYYQLLTWSGTSYLASTTIEQGNGYWALVLTPTNIIVS